MCIQVILCSYNGEKYIKEQIGSILGQTESSVRLLISDDCSSDRTAELCRAAAAASGGKVRFLEQEAPSGGAAKHFMKVLCSDALRKDCGPAAACGTAAARGDQRRGETEDYGNRVPASAPDAGNFPETAECALPDYVMFSDQDDLWHPDKAEKTLAAMKEAEEQYGAGTPLLVHCDMRVVDEAGNEISPSFVQYQKMTPERNRLNQLLVQNNVTGGGMMMNRALLEILREHPEPRHAVMHDQWIALTAAAFGHVVFLKESLYDYRQHGNNVLGAAKGSRVREILDRLGLFRKDGKTKADMDRHSASVYTALFRQASEFGRQYGDEISAEDRKMLLAFVSMRNMHRIGKILTIVRYGFTFNKLHRTVGEMLFI